MIFNISDSINIYTGYHTLSITNNIENVNIISNSPSFILIKQPEIISYEFINNTTDNYIKLQFKNPIINDMEYLLLNNISCRFTFFENSSEIKKSYILEKN